MTTSEWVKPGIYAAVVGTDAALVPVCLQMSREDPYRVAKLAAIAEATTYGRREAPMGAGWATVPGSGAHDRDPAQARMEGLDLEAA